jgi:hypothetical protein
VPGRHNLAGFLDHADSFPIRHGGTQILKALRRRCSISANFNPGLAMDLELDHRFRDPLLSA